MGEKQGGKPVPRDMPDQQARPGKDPWDAAEAGWPDQHRDTDLPDTDEAGTGPRGAPRPGAVHPEDLLPDEPSG